MTGFCRTLTLARLAEELRETAQFADEIAQRLGTAADKDPEVFRTFEIELNKTLIGVRWTKAELRNIKLWL